MKLDFTDMSVEQLTRYQEDLVTTMSRLKHGLYNFEAAMGLKSSLDLLGDLHIQTSKHLREIKAELATYNVNVDLVEESNEAD